MSADAQAKDFVQLLDLLVEETEGGARCCPEELSVQEIRCLNAVGRERCCIMSAVAAAIRLSLSSATGLIDRLVEKRLVRRERSSEDRRVVQVELTDEGRQVHEAALAGRVKTAQGLLGGLEPKEQAELVALFKKLADSAKAKRAKA